MNKNTHLNWSGTADWKLEKPLLRCAHSAEGICPVVREEGVENFYYIELYVCASAAINKDESNTIVSLHAVACTYGGDEYGETEFEVDMAQVSPEDVLGKLRTLFTAFLTDQIARKRDAVQALHKQAKISWRPN